MSWMVWPDLTADQAFRLSFLNGVGLRNLKKPQREELKELRRRAARVGKKTMGVPVSPMLPVHEQILECLAKPGARYCCMDPDEPWAPYLRAMKTAGWIRSEISNGWDDAMITDLGRRQLLLLRVLGEAA